jgi:amidohydrolase
MDGLPVIEENPAPYKSKNSGVHHACGHDAHMAIALSVAELLSGMRDQIPGTVKFIFQGAEEGAPKGEEGGAFLMIKEGVLENPKPRRFSDCMCGASLRQGPSDTLSSRDGIGRQLRDHN